MARGRLLLVAVGLIAAMSRPARLSGQGAPPPSSALDSARRVVPGDSTIRGSRLAAGTVRYSLTAYRDADEIPVGRLTDVLRVDTVAGVLVLVRAQQLERGATVLIDSSLTELRTLAPRRHRSSQPTRRIALDFTGRRVKGSLTPQDLPPVPIDTLLPQLAFDSGNWDLLVRALPLDSGYTARFPVYDVDAGLHQYHVAVTGRTTVQGEPAWVVVFTLARGRESVVWIGEQSRELLRVETLLNPTTLLRQERQPPP